MLINLHVKNLALIEEAEVDFGENLNILTGETGAGKSILIGSIQSALGARIPRGMIREGSDSAWIEMVFRTDSEIIRAKMEEMELPFEDGEIIISRRITNHRVINKINDTTVTTARLKELAPMLLDLSGQHENQLLYDPANHLKIIDHFGGEEVGKVRREVSRIYDHYREIRSLLSKQDIDQEQKNREIEFLRFEIDEITKAGLREGEDEELEKTYQKIAHSREILQSCGQIHDLLSAGPQSASDLISQSTGLMEEAAAYDETASGLMDQLMEIDALVNDFNRELSSYISSMEFDEESFYQIEERLNLINHLKSKYGRRITDILSYEKKSQARLHELENHEEFIENLRKEYDKTQKELEEACDRLTLLRKKASGPLCEEIREALGDLNFLHVDFDVQFEKAKEFGREGNDRACFMISTNPGIMPAPLAQIASGGELSRIMLAIKSVLADTEDVETLIFDEIDAGISGRTAQKVSEKLRRISRGRQVIAITHLPQIAAMADTHFLIEKTSDDSSTISQIHLLDPEESVMELARILGGTRITQTVIDSAREMKHLAEDLKG